MNRLVVDSSIVIKWFIPEPHSEEANQILTLYQNGKLLLYAPDLLYAEIGNIVWKKQQFQGLSDRDAHEILALFGELDLTIFPSATLLERAYTIATNYKRTVYDSLYVALSLQESCPFITADQKLVNALQEKLPVLWLPEWEPTEHT